MGAKLDYMYIINTINESKISEQNNLCVHIVVVKNTKFSKNDDHTFIESKIQMCLYKRCL